MQFRETGVKGNPAIILLHGGGLSWWSFEGVINALKDDYHIITPILDGHGEDGLEPFISIEQCASRLIAYIDAEHNGSVFALTGLSIGAQIAVEVLSRRPNTAKYAIIESALVMPMKSVRYFAAPMYRLCYGLTKQRWFARLQAKSLCLPKEKVAQYYDDGLLIQRQSLINLTLSNSSYRLKNGLTKTRAKALVIVGERELRIMKQSAQALHLTIPESELYVAPAMKHGELSLLHPMQYAAILRAFFKDEFRP